MSSGYTFTAKAIADLSDIWDYSLDQWDVVQAERYIRTIHAACLALANGRVSGQSAEHIRPGYRKHLVGMHLRFFRSLPDGQLQVVRILHQRMDVARHLD